MASRPVLALYRRYRPDTFADVIGQDHVVRPLTAGLAKGRINHAYLFSGPRGCGKTTSARVLARSLNCVDGPTATPCGRCDSCRDLARGGPGSLDVIEIDAASHRGIDDARELRERVTFAPVRDRFKVVIIDEAHQITNEGFNALLKVVEEPPDHVVFVFATTEPERVLGTIRSRTHHYPFRLVPPQRLIPHLEAVCEQEGVTVSPGALALVVRAGGGSVRDTLSVLDQLIAGAGPDGLDIELAGDLLGYIPEGLLDDMVAALAAVDGAAAFRAVHRAVESGHDPRRFAHDLLDRLRALVVVSRVGDGAAEVLTDQPPEAVERLRTQAAHLGAAELSRAADTVAAALTDMAGATSPRLLLELLVARLLVVGSEAAAVQAVRLDRLERQMAMLAGGRVPAPTVEAGAQRTASAVQPEPPDAPGLPALGACDGSSTIDPAAGRDREATTASPAVSVDTVRRSWDAVLDSLRELKRLTWTLVSENAQVIALDDRRLTLGFATAGLVEAFNARSHAAVVAEAILRATGLDREVVAAVDHRGGVSAATAAAVVTETAARTRGRTEGRDGEGGTDRRSSVDLRTRDPEGSTEDLDGGQDLGPDPDGAELVQRMLGGRVIAEEPGES